jgi:iron uptake system component EfeO
MTHSTSGSAARLRSRLSLRLVAVPLMLGLAACTTNDDSGGDDDASGSIDVVSTSDACELSATSAPAGNLTFHVENDGSEVTEFYLLGSDGLRIVGEVENIGPGLTRDLVLTAPEGDYVTACKPGMTGEGIRADFAVDSSDTEVEVTGADAALVKQANQAYAAYVEDQSAQLLVKTEDFVRLYKAGQDDEARALYPVARTHWERIETVAESFGDLDPKVDAREADLEEGQRWTGWHLIEKDLWPQRATDYTPLTPAERARYADDLLANTRILDERVARLTYGVDQIANGAQGLLDEVATGKVTGEEEYWSRTDLWDFQANVDGARVAFEGLAALLERKDPQLAEELRTRFDELQVLLDQHRSGDGFVGYDELTDEQVKQLADAVNALSEPLSQLTAAVLN